MTARSARLSFALLVAPLLLLGVACVTVTGGESSVTTYVFEIDAPAAQGSATTGGVLLISAPTAQAGYDTRRIVYMRQRSELHVFANSQWADTPARMLEPLLVQRLEAASHYDAVVGLSDGVVADYRLDTEIVALRHEFDAEPSHVRLVVRAQLIDMQERHLVAARTFEVVREAPTEDVYGGVLAMNQALGEALEQLAEFCAQGAARPVGQRE